MRPMPLLPAPRRGIAAPLIALMVIPLLGMIACAVDIGYMVVVRTELQNAADAGALAGAQPLMQYYVQYYTPANRSNQAAIYANALGVAKATARSVAARNTAGGVGVQLQDGTPNADVLVGYFDGTSFTPAPDVWQPGQTFPNSLQVTARRDATGNDSSSNGPVPLFFGPVFGMRSANQQAFAQASIYVLTSLSQFRDVSSLHVGMIPATFDVAVWRDFLRNGTITGTGDQFAGASVLPDGTGNNMLQVYDSNKSKGNFGSLPLDGTHTGNIKSQFYSGMTQSMYQTLMSNNGNTSTPLMPLPPYDINALQPAGGVVPAGYHDPNVAPAQNVPGGSWNWLGQPGFIASNASAINTAPGVYLLPLFQALDSGQQSGNYAPGIGGGSGYYYNIVDFVAVRLMANPDQPNRTVYVEPSAMVLDLNQVIGNTQLAGPPTTGTQLNTLFVAPRLTW